MKKQNLIVVLMIIILLAFPTTQTFAAAPFPFGGLVTVTVPCNTGLLVYVLTPLTGVIPFMWFTGELPFLSYTPPHPGQYLLGQASSVMAPCVIGIVPVGAGFPILFHGSSI